MSKLWMMNVWFIIHFNVVRVFLSAWEIFRSTFVDVTFKKFSISFQCYYVVSCFANPCILAPKSFKFKPNLQKNINLQTHTSRNSWDGYLSFVRNKRISSKRSTNPWKTELRLRQVTLFHVSSPWSMDFTSFRKFWNRLCFSKLSQA